LSSLRRRRRHRPSRQHNNEGCKKVLSWLNGLFNTYCSTYQFVR
jgi:hypothetical protein